MSDLVAVTGADGFIGSHLVETLVRGGSRVRAMVQYNSMDLRGWLDDVDRELLSEVDVVLTDIRDARAVHDFMDGASVVYHLAALIAIPYSYRAPRSYIDTNVTGTLNVMEAARDLETERVVHTSTSEVYGTARVIPIDESHPLQAQSPYSASKIAADKIVEGYYLSFGTPVVTLRPFNTFGPRQSARAVIPTTIAQLASGAREIRLGLLSPTRDFNFVTDTVAAFLAVGTAPAGDVHGRTFNAGSGVEVSIADMVRMAASILDVEASVVQDDERLRPQDSEVLRLVCDASALRSTTGWDSLVPFQEGLAITCRWFLNSNNLARYRADRYVI